MTTIQKPIRPKEITTEYVQDCVLYLRSCTPDDIIDHFTMVGDILTLPPSSIGDDELESIVQALEERTR